MASSHSDFGTCRFARAAAHSVVEFRGWNPLRYADSRIADPMAKLSLAACILYDTALTDLAGPRGENLDFLHETFDGVLIGTESY